jgi:hypothetical protein
MGNASRNLAVRIFGMKRAFGRPRHRWQVNVEMNLEKWCVNWIELFRNS